MKVPQGLVSICVIIKGEILGSLALMDDVPEAANIQSNPRGSIHTDISDLGPAQKP